MRQFDNEALATVVIMLLVTLYLTGVGAFYATLVGKPVLAALASLGIFLCGVVVGLFTPRE